MPILYEYFCRDCGQLRACLIPKLVKCGNCDSINIITAKPGSLNKDKLKEEWRKNNARNHDNKGSSKVSETP